MQGTPREIFSREEEIEELGLKLPQLCQLAKALRNEGMDIPMGITTEEELKDAITKRQISETDSEITAGEK